MTWLALKCVPYSLAAITVLNFIGLGRADNPFALSFQMLCWLIIIVHTPVILAGAIWQFIRWQFSLVERRSTSDPIHNTAQHRLFTSFKFMNGCALIALGVVVFAICAKIYNALGIWLRSYDVIGFYTRTSDLWGNVGLVCLGLIIAGLFLIFMTVLSSVRRAWRRTPNDEHDALSYLREGR